MIYVNFPRFVIPYNASLLLLLLLQCSACAKTNDKQNLQTVCFAASSSSSAFSFAGTFLSVLKLHYFPPEKNEELISVVVQDQEM